MLAGYLVAPLAIALVIVILLAGILAAVLNGRPRHTPTAEELDPGAFEPDERV